MKEIQEFKHKLGILRDSLRVKLVELEKIQSEFSNMSESLDRAVEGLTDSVDSLSAEV